MRSTLLVLLSLAGCGSPNYLGFSRQLAVDATAAEGEPIVERQRSYYQNDRSRPRLETTVRLYPDGTREKHGPEREWYDGGQLRWEREFRAGEPHGHWTSWHPNGRKASEATFGQNELTPMTWWYEDGQVSTEGQARNASRDGRWTMWHPNGAKRGEGDYRSNLREGEWTFWAEDGTLLERGRYRAGERVGAWERGE